MHHKLYIEVSQSYPHSTQYWHERMPTFIINTSNMLKPVAYDVQKRELRPI